MITKHKIKPGYTGIYIPENKLEKARVINSGIFWETPFISGSFCRVASVEQQLRIDGQEILTKDNISLRISALVRFQIIDPISYLKAYGIKDEQYDRFKQGGLVTEGNSDIYLKTQVLIRERISEVESTFLNDKKNSLLKELPQEFIDEVAEKGIKIVNIEILDLSFPKSIQSVFAKQLEAKISGLADLERARTQVATARTLKNAASIMKDNPEIQLLQKLETIKEISGKNKSQIVINLDQPKG